MQKDLPDDFKNHYYSNLLWETYNYKNVTKLLNKDDEFKPRSRDNLFIDIYEFTPTIKSHHTGKTGKPQKVKVRYDMI